MPAGSYSKFSLDLPKITSATSVPALSSSRRDRDSLSSLRVRTKNDRTPRTARTSQDFVHVAIRLKPPPPQVESSSLIQFNIEIGTLGSPRTGRRREGVLQSSASQTVKNVEETFNGSGSNHDDHSRASNSNSLLSSNIVGQGVTPRRNGTQQSPHSPRVGGGKLLTITSPTVDDVKEVQRVYEFGEVMGPTVTDGQLCDLMVPNIIEQLNCGFNACVLCYGQTGSGKTHTINALIPAFINALFENLDTDNDIVEISYIQIHNNNAYNLLSEDRSEHGVLLPKPRGTSVREPRQLVRDAAEVKSKISEAQKKRFISSHALNARSSRSHLILSFHITKCAGGIPLVTNRLTLCDLAGSERVKKTGVAGNELGEAIAINKSLSVLHGVIKATAEDADVLPVRESVLTLYLASTLDDCYLLLISTVSIEKQNYAETKSSLDFATTAKGCVVTKTKGKPRDLMVGGATCFEEVYVQLTKEVESLRQRVCTLQEELDIEKQRSVPVRQDINEKDIMKNEPEIEVNSSKTFEPINNDDDDDDAVKKMQNHIQALERECAVFQSLLRQRERELGSLESRGDVTEEMRQELEQRIQKREEAQRALEEAAIQLGTSDILRRLSDTFLWLQEESDSMYQQKRILAKAMDGLRSEQQRTMIDLLETRKQIVQYEKNYEEVNKKMNERNAENMELKKRVEELNLKLLREYVERAIREETVAWFKASGDRDKECEHLRTAFEDQRNLCDVLQSRLTSTEQELDRSNKQHGSLLQEMRKKDEAFRTIWLLLTPQQKARFMSIGYGGDAAGSTNTGANSASLHQGHENVQLRSQVRTLKRQLEEESLRNKERDYRIEDLESENRLLQERLQNREEEYNNLVSLDQDYRDEREQMEQQITHLYTYIEEHNAKQRVFERQLREAQSEWEKLDEEHRNAQRELVDVTAKLEKAKGEIRAHAADKDRLKDKLREAEERDAMLAGLHHQLTIKQRSRDEVCRRLGMAEKKRQHLASEVTIYNRHSDLLKQKVMQRNPEVLRRITMQRIDPSQYVRGNMSHSVGQTSRIQRLRHEVSQLLKFRPNSPVSLNGSGKTTYDSNSSSLSRHGRRRRRQTLSQQNPREVTARPVFLRANSALAVAPSSISEKTRRRNS